MSTWAWPYELQPGLTWLAVFLAPVLWSRSLLDSSQPLDMLDHYAERSLTSGYPSPYDEKGLRQPLPVTLIHLGPDHEGDVAVLVLQGDEDDAACRARPLPSYHPPGYPDPLTLWGRTGCSTSTHKGDSAFPRQKATTGGHRCAETAPGKKRLKHLSFQPFTANQLASRTVSPGSQITEEQPTEVDNKGLLC